MNSQDPYDLDILLEEAADGESTDLRRVLNLGIEADSTQNASPFVPDRIPEPSLQRSIIPQTVADEDDPVIPNPTSGVLHVMNDLPEEFSMMNADGSIRQLENSESPIRAPQEIVHAEGDIPHENQNAENMHMVDADRQGLGTHTARERENSSSNSDGQVNDPPSQVNIMSVSPECAPTEAAPTPHVNTDASLNQHHVPATHVQLRQGQLQLNEGNMVSQSITPVSPLGRLPVGMQNLLLAHARRQAYIDAELRAVQMAQDAAIRIHAMVQNGETALNSTAEEAALAYAALQRTQATATHQPVDVLGGQEPAPKMRGTQSWISSKNQSVGRFPPTQTLPPAPTPPACAQTIPVPHEAQALATQNLATSMPTSTAAPQATRLLSLDISRVSPAHCQSNKLAMLQNSLAPGPTWHPEAPHQSNVRSRCPSNHEINAQPVSFNHPELPATNALKQAKQLETVNNPEKPVSTRKRKRNVDRITHHFQPRLNSQTMNTSDEDGAAPRAPMVEEIMQMNGLRAQDHASNPHVSVTPNGHNVVVNKYGVKLRFSKNGQASKYCHVCGRSALTASVAECANLLIGLCQKVICEKCLLIYDPLFGRRGEVGFERSLCIHCRAICPEEKARCFQYSRNNEKRRARNLEKKRQKKEQEEQEKQREEGNKRLRENDDRDDESGISPTGVADPDLF